MSRRGWSASNYLNYASGVVTATPLTMCAWAKTSITGADQTIVSIKNSVGTRDINIFSLRVSTGNAVNANTGDGSNNSSASTSTTISADTWFHACAVFASSTSRAAYLNGAGKGTNTGSRTPSGVNRTSIGVVNGTAVYDPFAPAGTGDIAEVAIWNIALSDADVASLATGVSPLLVHPEALVGYWPLIGNNSPENNLLSNTSVMSITGSLSAAAHPRIILPARHRLIR